MPKYKKRPIIVEAYQFDSTDGREHPGVLDSDDGFFVQTKNGSVNVNEFDFIIQESDLSGYYPCNPEIFSKTYDPVLEGLASEKDRKEFFPLNEQCPNCKTNYLVANRKNQKWCSWKECGWGTEK